MVGYVTLGTNDLPRAAAFYDALLGGLGGKRFMETERLIVRTAVADDVDLIHALWTDPRVMTYVGFPQGMRITRNELRERLLKQIGSEFERLLVVELKATGQAIGQCALSRPDGEGVQVDVLVVTAQPAPAGSPGHRYGHLRRPEAKSVKGGRGPFYGQ